MTKTSDNYWKCVICQRTMKKKGIAIEIGNPSKFLVCKQCFHNMKQSLKLLDPRALANRKRIKWEDQKPHPNSKPNRQSETES